MLMAAALAAPALPAFSAGETPAAPTKAAKPDLVLSGVNRGANLAEDVTLSGTVAGAIEGMAMGIPSIALSQTGWPTGNDDIFAPAERFAPGIIRKLVETGWPKDVIINVNFPARPEPFRVWTKRVPFSPAALVRASMQRAWKSPQLEIELISR